MKNKSIIKDKLNEIITKFESPTELSATPKPNNGLNLLPLDTKDDIINAIKLFNECQWENNKLKESAAYLIAMLALDHGIEISSDSDIWNLTNSIPETKPEEKDMSLGGGGISLPSI